MMRPPPGGTSPHKAARSGPQNERISSAWRGRIGGIGPSGATAEGGAAAGASGASGAAAPGGGAPPSPMASTARRHRGESAAALTCKHRNAAAPPGLTPGQCTPKSERQAARTAPTCGEPGPAASFGIGADGGPGSAAGSGGGAGAASAGPGLLAAGAGGGGAGSAPPAAGFGPTASSADLQAADTLPALRLRH
jgi:hypothetical protein